MSESEWGLSLKLFLSLGSRAHSAVESVRPWAFRTNPRVFPIGEKHSYFFPRFHPARENELV